jgi:YggT family protein
VHIAYLIVEIYLYILIARIILSWIPTEPSSPVAKVANTLAVVTDPVLRQFRKVLPTVTVGHMAIDLSPLILCVALEVILLILA